jgi:predicted GIY-YIG superfamily endonuclease
LKLLTSPISLKKFSIPTLTEKLTEIANSNEDTVENAIKKRRERDRKHATYFKVGFSNYWRTPISQTIKNVKKRFPTLSWLRVLMSYRRFLNLRELFQGDLNSKVTRDVVSLDFANLQCNCRGGICKYNDKCRHSIVVYQTKCQVSGKKYVGCTQQHLKKRIQQHENDVKNLYQKGFKSDSFANHFAKNIPRNTQAKKSRSSSTQRLKSSGKVIQLAVSKLSEPKVANFATKKD